MPARVDGQRLERGIHLHVGEIGMPGHPLRGLIGGGVAAYPVLTFEGDVKAPLRRQRQTFGIRCPLAQRGAFDVAQRDKGARLDRLQATACIADHRPLDEMPPVGQGDEARARIIQFDGRETAEIGAVHLPAIAAKVGHAIHLPGLAGQAKAKSERAKGCEGQKALAQAGA